MTLPDSSFLYARGDKRLFQYKDRRGKVDLAIVAEAIPQIIAAELPASTKAGLIEKARAILKRTTEAELQSYIHRKGPDMASDIFARISESVVSTLQKLNWGTRLKVAVDREQRRAATPPPAAPEEAVATDPEPVAESMMESYPLPAEALSEVAAFEEGKERVLRGCTFIRAGLNSPQTRRWPATLLESSLECFQDALCFIDHPSQGQPRSLRALAGHTRNARFDKATNSVMGDIVLLTDNEAADYVVSLVSNPIVRESNQIGISVLFENPNYEADFEQTAGGKTVQVPTRLGPGKATCDLVANPTAFGKLGSLS